MSDIKAFKLLSGYLSISDNSLVTFTEDRLADELQASILLKPLKKEVHSYLYSLEIDQLLEKFLTTPNLIKDVSFQEEVLSFYFKMFKEIDFLEWIALQKNSLYFSETHSAFLEDTAGFIYSNNRKLSILTWLRLVKLEENVPKAKSTKIEVTLPSTHEEILSEWLASPNGFEDLLVTLKIIFGK
jgi:hypothetical protein